MTTITSKRTLIRIYACVIIITVGYGISFPLLSLSLDRMGASGQMIGVNASMPALGWLIGSFFLPYLQSKFALKSIFLALLSIAALSSIGFWLFQSYWVWIGLRLLFGGCLGLFFRTIEFWLNANTKDSERGKIIGLYTACFMLGIAIGSGLQPLLGYDLAAYAVIFSLIAVGAGLIFFDDSLNASSNLTRTLSFNWLLFLLMPIPMLGILSYGLFEDIPAYLMSVYAVKKGLGDDVAAYTLTAAALGTLAFAVPIGRISDFANRYMLLVVCSLVVIAGAVLIPLSTSSDVLFLLFIFVWAGFASGIYIICLAIIGDHFKGAQLVQANANFGFIYAFGGIVGPLVNGFAIQKLNADGIMVSSVIIFSVFALCVAVMMLTKKVPARAD